LYLTLWLSYHEIFPEHGVALLLRIISGIRESELLVIYLYERIFQKWFELVAPGSASKTMPVMKDVIEALKADSETVDVKVMVGGAPLTQEYADSIGAKGYAPDASSAVALAKELLA